MEKEQILSDVQEIFRTILDQENLVLKPETTAADVEDWDSLSHIQLVVAIEKHFKIRFTSKEIQSWKNVEEMISSIQSK
jgi:acyl carrier protein